MRPLKTVALFTDSRQLFFLRVHINCAVSSRLRSIESDGLRENPICVRIELVSLLITFCRHATSKAPWCFAVRRWQGASVLASAQPLPLANQGISSLGPSEPCASAAEAKSSEREQGLGLRLSGITRSNRLGVFGGEEEEGGVRSGSGAARTILLFHIISASPSKQPRMVGSVCVYYCRTLYKAVCVCGGGSTLGVYSVGLIFVSARTNKKTSSSSRDDRVVRADARPPALLASASLALVRAEALCPSALLACAPLSLVGRGSPACTPCMFLPALLRTDFARLLLRGTFHCVGLSAPPPLARAKTKTNKVGLSYHGPETEEQPSLSSGLSDAPWLKQSPWFSL